jgi:hypothetical protein
MASGHSHVTRNEVYIEVPRNINKEEVIIVLIQIRFQPRTGQTKDYTIDISYFSAKLAVLRSKSNKDYQDNMSERGNMSTRNIVQ